MAETFDAFACLDAALYLPDNALVIARLSRVVEPGRRVLLVDWCRQAGLSAGQEELVLQPFMRYWSRMRPGSYGRASRWGQMGFDAGFLRYAYFLAERQGPKRR